MLNNQLIDLHNIVLQRKNNDITIEEYIKNIKTIEQNLKHEPILDNIENIDNIKSINFLTYIIDRFNVDVEVYKYELDIGNIDKNIYNNSIIDLAIDTSSFNFVEPIKYLLDNNFINIQNQKICISYDNNKIDTDIIQTCIDNKSYKVLKYLYDNDVSLLTVYNLFENICDYHSLYILSLFSLSTDEFRNELNTLMNNIEMTYSNF